MDDYMIHILHCMICYCRYDNRRHLEFCIVSVATNCAVIALLIHENVIWVQNSNIIGPSNICFYSKQKNFRFTIKIHFFAIFFFAILKAVYFFAILFFAILIAVYFFAILFFAILLPPTNTPGKIHRFLSGRKNPQS
jgi:hypothetical protein